MFKKVGKKWWYFLGALVVAAGALLLSNLAVAGTGGPMSEVYTDLTGWCQGYIGKVISLGMILVGIVGGIARQSLMSFATGIGGGLGLYNAPTIIDSVLTATLHAGIQ